MTGKAVFPIFEIHQYIPCHEKASILTSNGRFPAAFLSFPLCNRRSEQSGDPFQQLSAKGLRPQEISSEDFLRGIAPPDFHRLTGANYKPSWNEDPGISPQCWIEKTGYGTQNACKYCHTDYLASINHGNAYPIAEDQILYSFHSANLNRILWRNIIYPHEIIERLTSEGIPLPEAGDYNHVREDNWTPA